MLSETLKIKMQDGEEIPTAQCHCYECDNNFWVAVIHENEPKYCPYCGIKFIGLSEWDGTEEKYKPRREILGE